MNELIKEIEIKMASMVETEEEFANEGYSYEEGSDFFQSVSDEYYSMLKRLIAAVKGNVDES